MDESKLRDTGYRVKRWGIDEAQANRLAEATAEHPIMYQALGTAPKTSHPFNLYDDIRAQPQALTDTLRQNATLIAAIADEMIQRGITRVVGAGLGTSQFVAQVAANGYWTFAGLDADQADAVEFQLYDRPYAWRQTAFMAYSGSGATTDSNRAAQRARERGAYVIALTSVAGSPLSQIADVNIVCAGGYDTGGSDTFHYTTRLAAALMLALEIGQRARPDAHDYAALKQQLLAAGEQMAAAFEAVDARCRSIAKRLKHARSVLVVGSGPQLGTAEEIALKFDEMCHIPAKALCWGRHVHGALGLTDERIHTLIVAPPGAAYARLIEIAKVTQMLKTPSIGIVTEADEEIASRLDEVIRLPALEETLFSVLAILPGQLLPYYCAVELGDVNPDCQRSNIPKYARVWHMLFPPGTH
ncbi:MAG TPA: SIS domain-containing protein [Anaerolineae bacterium]|nr:SIS domain-containing protein [Anaerolineae bacterium]